MHLNPHDLYNLQSNNHYFTSRSNTGLSNVDGGMTQYCMFFYIFVLFKYRNTNPKVSVALMITFTRSIILNPYKLDSLYVAYGGERVEL